MTKDKITPDPRIIPRRSLLVGLPSAGAAMLATRASADSSPNAVTGDDDDPRQVRLKDSDHVRTYYALARR